MDGAESVAAVTAGRPVLLVFSSSWATPCVPLLEDIVGFEDRACILVVKADPTAPALPSDSLGFEVAEPTDDELLSRMEVEELPTVVLFDRAGRVTERLVGYSPGVAKRIESALQELAEDEEQ